MGRRAVRKSVSITEAEAIDKTVVDLVAINEQDLLKQIDNKIVDLNGASKRCTQERLKFKVEMTFVENFLNIIAIQTLLTYS
jgi:membrane-bound serine protease (ClpP class)